MQGFYDSMKFWNKNEGIAMGDLNDCLSIIITRDGGNTWNKVQYKHLKLLKKAAFCSK
jgi:photosystem II stability/assembly factor-like uncharacterized protein